MTKRRIYLAAGLVVALATPAIAGEITGNGAWTPVHYGQASSVCSYSGVNDTPGLDGFEEVQSYGMLVRAFGGFSPGFDRHPGVACRG